MKNPFIISGYAGEDTFCDRIEETKRLISLITNGNNVVLTSPRRVGKTDLIKHVFAQKEIRDNYITISTDIYATQNFEEFVANLWKSIVEALRPKGKKWLDRFVTVVASLRSQLTFDINGFPVWNLGLGEISNPTHTLEEIFQYIEGADRPCIVAIDEFQQITKYPDAYKVEALLRTYIQHTRNVNFIYSGSQQHLMAEMFISAARPFYMSSTLMSLPLIDRDVYKEFCMNLFKRDNKEVMPEAVDLVYDEFDGITAYMQRVMNELYSSTDIGECCGTESVERAVSTILDQASDSYETLFYQLTERQRATMMAIASHGPVANPTKADFINKYKLLSASSVSSSIKTLLDKDLLTKNNTGVMIYDKFFQLWLRKKLC